MRVACGHTGLWTADDVLALPENDSRYEVVDGALIVNPPPSPGHQDASFELALLLRSAARQQGGALRAWEAVGVRMLRDEMLIPDIVVAKSIGAPLIDVSDVAMVVELATPGSATRDRHTKHHLYAEAGIPQFWRIELDTLPVVFAYTLGPDGEYELAARVGAGETFRSADPLAVEFDPGRLVL
jgi:Uma2 family endonuclease